MDVQRKAVYTLALKERGCVGDKCRVICSNKLPHNQRVKGKLPGLSRTYGIRDEPRYRSLEAT